MMRSLRVDIWNGNLSEGVRWEVRVLSRFLWNPGVRAAIIIIIQHVRKALLHGSVWKDWAKPVLEEEEDGNEARIPFLAFSLSSRLFRCCSLTLVSHSESERPSPACHRLLLYMLYVYHACKSIAAAAPARRFTHA